MRGKVWGTALLLLAAAARAQDALPAPVQAALRAAGLPAEALAVAALPLQHAAPPYRHQAQRPMQPGSSMKLLTSIVALDRLGPNHRGFTELRSSAAVSGGTLQGDLVLRGGGDVELGVPQLWALLLQLQAAGVRHIAGDVIVDRTRYRPARSDVGLLPFDEAPEFPYNVIPDALNLAGSLLPLRLQATGSGVTATTVPPLEGLAIDTRMTLVDARCNDWDDHWQPATLEQAQGRTRITLNGAFPRGCTVSAELQLIDRAELTERLLRQLWQGLGGTLGGRVREAGDTPPPAAAHVLARRDARPWGELLRHLNKQSDNAWTRVLFLELGVAHTTTTTTTTTTTRDAADAALRHWLREQRIDDTGLVLDNGSGLSRSERATPLQMAQALQAAWHGRHAAELQMSLPTAGVDGTMRNRLKDSPAGGWARLKTGTLRNVVALAGYVRDAQGRPWAVALMINHDDASRGRPVLDTFIDHIARHGLPGAPRGVGPQQEGP